MRKIFFILAMLLSCAGLFAQDPSDALRFSWITSNGTARQQAVGGAMTSLGGDISATFVNPAGLGFYKTGDIVLTPGLNFNNNRSSYYGRTEDDEKINLSFGTSGIVFGSGSNYKNKKNYGAAVALAINRTASFGNNILYRGLNTQNSYSQKFLEEIRNRNDRDGNSVANNYPFGTSLAFNTYWIDTIAGGSSNNYEFKSRATIGNLLQENTVENYGGISELALGVAFNSNDKFFFGGSVGVPFLYYHRNASFTEADATDNPNNNFDFGRIDEELTTKGVGVNLKLGFIYKPAEFIRLGLAVHSPSFYTLNDMYSASVTTNTEMYKGNLNQNSRTLTGGYDGDFDYALITPYRIMASASYVLREIQDVRKQRGFLTADIEYVNYKAASFSGVGDPNAENKTYFKSLNTAIDNAYKGAFNFKAGGELKFTTVMARLGLAYYGNPYLDLGHEEKGDRFSLSGGLGYRNKGIFVDLTYVHTMGKDVHFAYRLQNAAYSGATLKQTGGNVLLTVGFKI